MANELKHGDQGPALSKAEFEGVGLHVFNSQATGDIVYASSSSQLSRLAAGSTNDILRITGGIPDWQATSFITSLGTIATGVWQGTDVGVEYGGTGVSTLTDGGVLLGSGEGAITAMAVLTDGQMIVGNGTTDPVAESGATLRTSIGVGTGDTLSLNAVTSAGNITITNGNLIIGTAAKGIDFSNQASPSAGMTAELLDRYEIGTFTPALKNGVSGNTMSHTTQFGHYTRIGNRVHINLRVTVDGNGDATDAAMAIFGLPFTCDSTANSETGMICGYSAGLNLGAAGYSLNGATDANGTAKFWLKQWSATGGNSANVTRDEISTDATLNFSGMYEVD